MQATFADFSATPAGVSNAGIRYRHCHKASSHLVMGADASTELEFEIDDEERIAEATLKVTALVSKLGGSPGYAPVDVLVNGKALVQGFTVPGGGDLPQDNVLAVPGDLLRQGTNTLEIRTGADARSMFWLYRVTLDSVYERGRSERAMAAEAARDTVFTYTTERRLPFTSTWRPGPRCCSTWTGASSRCPPSWGGGGRTARSRRSASSRTCPTSTAITGPPTAHSPSSAAVS